MCFLPLQYKHGPGEVQEETADKQGDHQETAGQEGQVVQVQRHTLPRKLEKANWERHGLQGGRLDSRLMAPAPLETKIKDTI